MKTLQLSRSIFPCMCLSFSFRMRVHSSETHTPPPISIILSLQWIHGVAALHMFFKASAGTGISWARSDIPKLTCPGPTSAAVVAISILGQLHAHHLEQWLHLLFPFPPLNSPRPWPFLHCSNTSHWAHCYLPSSVRAKTHPSSFPTWPRHLPCSSSKVCHVCV